MYWIVTEKSMEKMTGHFSALDQLGECTQAVQYAEQALTIFEEIEEPRAGQVRAQLAAWREQSNT